jgi:adenylate cyclase
MQKLETAEAADDRFQFRIGINSGEVVVDGEDVLGDCVNIAARLESLAPPGGICVGKTVFELVDGKVDTKLTPLGPQQVKNIPHLIDARRVEIDGVATQASAMAERDRASIAVLPFDNMSSDPEQDFLADGIVEDVITELSRFRDLFVMARNSSFAYKGNSKDVRQIAKELGVEYIVEGSVRRAGNRLRVTAQLIEAGSGTHVWADRWDRTIEDLFELQDELTGAIVSAVQPELGAHERALTLRKPVGSLSVWE